MTDINRKISFYRGFFWKDDEQVEPRDIFSHIGSLPFTRQGRYLPLGTGNSRSMYVDSVDLPMRLIIGTKRESGLPLMELEGDRTPLDIPETGGLYEPMHFMIFPNNVIGFEYNSHAPRIGSLKSYLPQKAPTLVDKVELIPLMRSDIRQEISRMGNIRLFNLAIHRNMADHLEILNDNLIDALNHAFRENEYSEVLEIVLRPKKYSKGWINLSFLNRIPQFISEAREDLEVAKIRAENLDNDGKVEDFNLLSLFVSTRRDVDPIDEDHRVVNAESMFHQINEAYHELLPEINDIITEELR